MSDNTRKTKTAGKPPSHIAYHVRRPRRQERLLDAHRCRLATQRRQGLQYPARRRPARSAASPSASPRKRKIIQSTGRVLRCPPTT